MTDRIKIMAAVVTASDTRKPENDVSGARAAELLAGVGAAVVASIIVSDDVNELTNTLADLMSTDDVNLVITTGGTGFGPRDNTPEATRRVIEREAPGIAEAMRRETFSKTPKSMLSRAVAGIANGTLIVNLPGSPRAVEECFEVLRPVLQHAIDLIGGETAHHS